MLFYKELDQEGVSQLLNQISRYTQDILLQKGSKLSYQLAYDQIYQLCRNQKQQKLLQTLYSTLSKVLPQVFTNLNLDPIGFIDNFAQLIETTQKNIQKINHVCLYLDLNYCKRDLGVALKTKLNQIFLAQFFKQTQLVKCVGRIIAESHIKEFYEDISKALNAIKLIDCQEQYFLLNFVNHYLPIITKHYCNQAQQQFTIYNQSKQIHCYIKYATLKLQKENLFLNKYWPQYKKCGSNKTFIMRELYEILVTKYKDQIYNSHKVKLFNQLTLQILELFKYGTKSSDIQKHADWYNLQIKEKLQTFSHSNNTQFIDQICVFYKKIMTILQSTYNKFDIHYRSRFAFEEWINGQRLQMPLRLNDYINQYCLGLMKEDELIVLERIAVVFVLMKEKNFFEKYYRRQVINRILNNLSEYPQEKESKIIQLMQKQCSEEFVKHVKKIIQSYKSNKESLYKNGTSQKLTGFLLNTENWPYDEKNTSVTLNQEMIKMTRAKTQAFIQGNKDKSLYWHPIIGVVKVEMSFLQSRWKGQLVINTCMANILLYFLKTSYKPFQLKIFCCQTGYKLDEIYESVRKLIHANVLTNQGSQESYKLSINESFSHSQSVFDVLNVQNSHKFEAKPLQELKADRKFMVEAIIVKIMKKLKHTDKETILKEASPLIEKRGFNFNAKFVESALDRLIDKQFIRDYQDGKYGYIA